MAFTKTLEKAFEKYVPSPFVIAVFLTLFTIVLGLFFTKNTTDESHIVSILKFWEKGIWNSALLVFGYQMMLILVLGHILVLSKPMSALTDRITSFVHSTTSAVILVSITTMLVAFFNWGLGLIFGAIMARKVAEASLRRGFSINYPLVGASGYVGLMIWHGGISGSAPLKVAETGHLQALMQGITSKEMAAQIPDFIATSETVLSWWNLTIFGVLLLVIPITLYFLAKKSDAKPIHFLKKVESSEFEESVSSKHIENSKIAAISFGGLILVAFFVQYFDTLAKLVITPNMLNFFMLGLGIILHGSFSSFANALGEAISGVSGILIQFPLYFGIMGIMKDAGMVLMISNAFISVSNEVTLPIFTFFSAGLVNIFVPSGGGQWALQGPIVIESALQLGVPLPKMVMALSYGDQITNMLQPFWALPLLAITKLKAKEILPYTIILMLVGSCVFLLGLLLF
ncbi:MAG: short-chain fatty acid transporter [Flavobacteriaceae bacterium CG_4_8_14_3_um_filter_34_10]|nr:MAG: short-chain fatty acid transporter [Flavobacteriaceae bacterium CG18_big_fil_WC_8_21_14_2_50_34_36]PIV48779.1 MAG: short-chain fatty acid transporter [Flavobacteriaceae bacterium CG02_land_8_20_14_3_00_34_13]PIX09414.1 MAG: short-chain fatty acid transporter [Flavobacteriaceae bacterium CG_4_8_14_3_um_filter_34_10]PIZ07622.1 MAG: short-chain fatty acid transporter [Flavobacteriaceae bacterium CG_4_10_14_0_8_um_filter_34_31]PJC08146.1 MAG: short-chain fatty acid transporter [Flavobacteri